MASAREIKKRIRSTRNIAQITKAMEAVAAVKMRKSQDVALRSRPYSFAALKMLKNLSAGIEQEQYTSPLLDVRPVQKICLVVVTSDKGLAGAFNSNALRRAQEFMAAQSVPVDLVTIGKRGRDFFRKRGVRIIQDVIGVGDYITPAQTQFIAKFLSKLYNDKEYDQIMGVYTNFISVLRQEVVVEQLLPFTKDELEKRIMSGVFEASASSSVYIYEPSLSEVLDTLLPLLMEVQMYHVVLEANASEHSARMVAMKNASENASDLIGSLTLKYNKARQEQITKELTEITAGAAALS